MSYQNRKQRPLFSILIPVYNSRDYIASALRSVVNQTCSDYEVILIDDGSTDGSGKECDAFTAVHDCSLVVHQENRGLLLTRRVALQRARGKYIVNLDSDDALRSDALERLRDIIRVWEPDIIGFDYSRSDDFTSIVSNALDMSAGFYDGDDYKAYQRSVCCGLWISLWSKCYKRSIADVDEDYSRYENMTYAEDLLQSIPLARKARNFYYLNESLYFYRLNSSSCTAYYHPEYPDGLMVALRAFIGYAAELGTDYLLMARACALLHVSTLLHVLVKSGHARSRALAEIARIRGLVCLMGLFGPWESSLRMIKRFEMRALERGWCDVLRWGLMIVETAKRLRNRSHGRGNR